MPTTITISYDEAPGEGRPIDRLFPVMFEEAMKDGLDKAVMLLLCAGCDMGAEDISVNIERNTKFNSLS